MANRIPLIVNSSALQIQELPIGDTLDLSNCSITTDNVNVSNNITVSNSVTVSNNISVTNDVTVSGNLTVSGTLTGNVSVEALNIAILKYTVLTSIVGI